VQAALDQATAVQGERERIRLDSRLPDDGVAPAIPLPLLVAALRNLLDNALRHAGASGAVSLTVEPAGPDAMVRFLVLDDGPGLTEAQCRQATQRFWRAAAQPEGSGLGLSIVQAIAQAHGCRFALRGRTDGPGLAAEFLVPLQPGQPHQGVADPSRYGLKP
jgi:two-component system, OmpR family, sensor histidine kinase QseC